ncbi:hypothetical protein RSOLAG22IIIB_08037 [Rhizoctonia solani]|uniref:Uncharacterized protein n=1 Tax=Rhizoctonia solani TaxID=456999 RepID=A0A0K6FRD4_9AGAM|nr:hypothetical protein RSOLAG22IIIB_08037 [Rhizoctonia solani]
MSKRKVVSDYELSPEVSGSELEVPPPEKSKLLESPSLSLSTFHQYDACKSSSVVDVQDISEAPGAPICSLHDAEAPIAAEKDNRAPVSDLPGDEFSLDESSEEEGVPKKGVPSILGFGTRTSRQSAPLTAVHMAQVERVVHLITLVLVRPNRNSTIFYTPLSPEAQAEPASILPMAPSIDAWVMRDSWDDPVDPDMPQLERYATT